MTNMTNERISELTKQVEKAINELMESVGSNNILVDKRGETIYLVTCKDALTEEKYAFQNLDTAEKCFSECVKQAFEWEETETDDDGWNEEECLLNWEFHCGDYSAKIEKVTVEG